MQVQTVFKAGNSDVVAIPQEIKRRTGVKTGTNIIVDVTSDGKTIVINKVENAGKKTFLSLDFFSWIEKFNKEYGSALKKLAEK